MRVAVTSRSFSRHPQLREELLARYPGATLNLEGRALAGPALVRYLRGHEAAIVALERLDREALEALPELRVVSKYGVGLDGLDLDAMARLGVRVGWTPGVNALSVAELTVGAMVVLLHRAPEASRIVHEGGWRQLQGRQLSGRVVGIVGCGHVGKHVARLCRAFGCRVLANDILDFPAFYAEYDVKPVALESLVDQADVITLHVPLDASTRGLLGPALVARARRGAIILNSARGGVLDEAAVKVRLLDGSLGGAFFDVLADEPPTDRELVNLPNVLVTPHIGGSTEEAVLAMGRAAIAGLLAAVPVAQLRAEGKVPS